MENDNARLKKAKAEWNCPIFTDYRQMLDANISADIVAIATQDSDHLEHAEACMKKGYNILLEKPIASQLSDCIEIANASKKYKVKIIVCHVLRYTPFYRTIKQIIKSGQLGEIITINASENVGYWHQSHSFVRGLWRNSMTSAPMILTKCCHDMDILCWLIDKKPKKVSSIGGLSVYRREKSPVGSAEFCSDCKVKCIYRAQDIYLEHRGMANYFNPTNDKSDKTILQALEKTDYDRCVYKCENNVVDHQNTVITFEDGVTASHLMTAFSQEVYRDIKIHGTKAELVGVMETNALEIRLFGGKTQTIPIETSKIRIGGHGGGDMGLMHDTYLNLNEQNTIGITYIDTSIDSHKIAFAAEKSRLDSGNSIEIK